MVPTTIITKMPTQAIGFNEFDEVVMQPHTSPITVPQQMISSCSGALLTSLFGKFMKKD